MRESQRLAYLQAIGVTGWVPRVALAHAAMRAPAEPESFVEVGPSTCSEPAIPANEPRKSDRSSVADSIATPAISASAKLAARQRVQLASPTSSQKTFEQTPPQAEEVVPSAGLPQKGRSVAPFYLQLWMAGPCALLVEISDPGLEKGTSEHNLLCDILRAAGLPVAPRLQADFRWPLSRNPQVARSAEAASEALQAFMQARLELQPVNSIGCFGAMAGLLATGDPDEADALKGREQALEELGAGWFAPGIEVMLRQPEEKARLWQLLKRVMPRWVEAK